MFYSCLVPPRAALAAGGVLVAACSGVSAPEPPAALAAETPYIRGPVGTVMAAAGATPAQLLVSPAAGAQESCGIRASVPARTRVLRRTPDGAVRGATLNAVRVGDTVEIYVAGAVALSCPAQGEASTVVLVGTVDQ